MLGCLSVPREVLLDAEGFPTYDDDMFRAVSDSALATLLTRSARIVCDDEDVSVLGALARRVED
jgi:hypothetical protein